MHKNDRNKRNFQPEIVKDVGRFNWQNWQPKDKAALCFILDGEQVLLIRKKRGLGAGKINAPGGRIEAYETPLQAAIRETVEETGLTPHALQPVADLSFVFTNGYSIHSSVFLARSFQGIAYETPEAIPIWFARQALPFHEMWQDDPYWVPHIFNGEFVKGYFIYEEDTLLSYKTTILT
jgi:8-oxo-dGTP diphosphatase